MGLFVGVAVGVCIDPWVWTAVGGIMTSVMEEDFERMMPTDTPTAIATRRMAIVAIARNSFFGR